MIKFQIVKKMRSLKTLSQTFADHFPDVSNMVVRGSVCVKTILNISVAPVLHISPRMWNDSICSK